MSYLDPEEDTLTPAQERLLRHTERVYNNFHYPHPKKHTEKTVIPLTFHMSTDNRKELQQPYLISDYFKVDIRKIGEGFIINYSTYQHLCSLIQRRYGKRPLFDQLSCCAISIWTIPEKNCSLYTTIGEYDPQHPPTWELVASFRADDYARQFNISCPYIDSSHQTNTIIFNWGKNNKQTGRPQITTYESKYTYRAGNDKNINLPWVHNPQNYSFYIEGIQDNIAFHVTFLADDTFHDRRSNAYNRRQKSKDQMQKIVHIPRQELGNPGEVGWTIPSQDYIATSEDPLFEALTK